MSSYGLILLIVFFFKKQIENGKIISIKNGNLGRLFYEFLYFYGIQFEPTKHIVNVNENIKSPNSFFEQFYVISSFLNKVN